MKNSKLVSFYLKSFKELKNRELYEILQLRSEVFVVEQKCVYNDLDGLDQNALHLFVKTDQVVSGYVRLLKPGTRFHFSSIGRVVTHKKYRHKGISTSLMKKAISIIFDEWGSNRIKISAQKYLLKFYESLGFVIISDEYLEDGIPHFEMILNKEN